MNRAFAKADRIGQVERLLLTSQIPLSQAEIARRCDVHRSTIGRLVQSMIDDGIPLRYTDDGLVSIERTAYISKIHLKLHEALAVFLACRLLARYSDKPTSHTITTLEKLGASLQRVMPGLGHHIGSTSAAVRARLPQDGASYQRILETLTEAWAQGRKVRLWYRPLHAPRAFEHTFAPYFLEPSAIGYSTYALGVAEPPGQLRTRKLERIERVELTDEPFAVPASFDPNTLLAGAWGIWFDDGDKPVQVRLRFAGEPVIRRLAETLWHPSQRTETDEQGRLIWTADIDEPLEMLPWIRGWGSACEALDPPELRDAVVRDLRRLIRVYDLAPAVRADGGLVAHTPAPGTDDWHMLVDHLTRVAELARDFAAPFGGGDLAYQLGLWHDVGKASPDFQNYLRRCYAQPHHPRGGVDHKAAGAVLALEWCEPLALLVQGHHGGLTSKTDLRSWLDEKRQILVTGHQTRAVDAAFEALRPLVPAIDPPGPLVLPDYARDERSAEFFLRMLFSALVDADFLDTEAHQSPRRAAQRGSEITITELVQRSDRDQAQKLGGSGPVNAVRDELYRHCLRAAEQLPGLFRLAMPTGGGKTRAGMGFALHHAARHGKRRVIVAVPFISITEQTASIYRTIFGDDNDEQPVVLEHHSGAGARHEDVDDYAPGAVWSRLAAENWDAPIVVTTTVQLFESLFGNRPGACRKLHRLANSVIVLDEAQALPPHLLTPILDGLRELCQHYGTTVVLSTATQPSFEHIRAFKDLTAYDIIHDAPAYFQTLSRVRYKWRIAEPTPWAEIADTLRSEHQALAVVNTKGDALALLDALGDDPDVLHLSTLLCGAHRRAVIEEVRRRLALGTPCRLVSTQVIEAGVDLDFPLVLRAMGPLDRIIQAAGRCNREGRIVGKGRVIIFRSEGERMPSGAYRIGAQVTQTLLRRGPLDLDSPATAAAYFRGLYATLADANQEIDSRGVQELRARWRYAEVAEQMRLIDDVTEDVIVAYGTPADRVSIDSAVDAIRGRERGMRWAFRVLQPFTVALPRAAAQRYRAQGFIEPLLPDSPDLPGRWIGVYDELRGVVTDDDRISMVI